MRRGQISERDTGSSNRYGYDGTGGAVTAVLLSTRVLRGQVPTAVAGSLRCLFDLQFIFYSISLSAALYKNETQADAESPY